MIFRIITIVALFSFLIGCKNNSNIKESNMKADDLIINSVDDLDGKVLMVSDGYGHLAEVCQIRLDERSNEMDVYAMMTHVIISIVKVQNRSAITSFSNKSYLRERSDGYFYLMTNREDLEMFSIRKGTNIVKPIVWDFGAELPESRREINDGRYAQIILYNEMPQRFRGELEYGFNNRIPEY